VTLRSGPSLSEATTCHSLRRDTRPHQAAKHGLLAYGCGGGGAGGLSQLPGVPAGTCIPSQLHGIIDRHAMNAHC
jgi:hypothetical protein